MVRFSTFLIGIAFLVPALLSAQTTASVWLWDQWHTMEVSEQYLMITPDASPTPILDAAGFPGFELVWNVSDCTEFLYGVFARPYASDTPTLFSTVDVIETLGVGTGQGYFWSPFFSFPGEPLWGYAPTPFTWIVFTSDTTDSEARAIIHAAGLGTVYSSNPAANWYRVLSAVPSGLVVNERMAPLVDHPKVTNITVEFMGLSSPCPSGGGSGGGSPWDPSAPSPLEIPTLSQWSLAVLALMLAGIALRRLDATRSRLTPRAVANRKERTHELSGD